MSDVPTFNGGNEILVSGIVDTFVLVNLSPQSKYYWRVLSENAAGTSAWSTTWNFTTGTYTGTDDEIVTLPKEYTLRQNYPNPFNPMTTIKYAVPKTSLVSIKVYDLTGQEVASLINEIKEVGTYEVKFDARNLASGIYLYRMFAGDFTAVKKLNVLK